MLNYCLKVLFDEILLLLVVYKAFDKVRHVRFQMPFHILLRVIPLWSRQSRVLSDQGPVCQRRKSMGVKPCIN